MTDGMFCARYLSQYQEIFPKTRLFGTRNCSKLGRSLYLCFLSFLSFFFLNMCHYHHYYFISLLFSVAKEVDVKMDFVK